MANVTKTVKILQVTKTTAEWAAIDQILDNGLLCIERTEDDQVLAKVGDGVHDYVHLPYVGTAPVSLSNFYTKTETDLAIAEAIEGLSIGNASLKGVIADSATLPESGVNPGEMYLVGPKSGTTDTYEQYIYAEDGEWHNIGERQTEEIDLSDYVTKVEFDPIKQAIELLKLEQDPHENRLILDQITAPFTTELETKLNDIAVFQGAISEDIEHEIEAQNGTSGLVPAPTIADVGKFLRGDGQWAEISTIAYDDTELRGRIETLETDCIKVTDDVTFQCST